MLSKLPGNVAREFRLAGSAQSVEKQPYSVFGTLVLLGEFGGILHHLHNLQGTHARVQNLGIVLSFYRLTHL